jgi:hypothetical protein
MQSRLTRGQPRAGDAVTARPRPTPGGRRSQLVRGQPQVGDAIMARLRPTLNEEHIFDSPEGGPGDTPEGAQLRRPTLQGGPASPRPTPDE